jgi:hypothetical protein
MSYEIEDTEEESSSYSFGGHIPAWLQGLNLREDQKVTLTKEPITAFKNMKRGQQIFFKPSGLWYGCGDAWIDWLKFEMPDWLSDGAYLYEIKLGPGMLFLRTIEEILAFNKKFGVSGPAGRYERPESKTDVDWRRVADRWSGIEICPYQYNLRMSPFAQWYYTWDVASGCIWGPKPPRAIKLIAAK